MAPFQSAGWQGQMSSQACGGHLRWAPEGGLVVILGEGLDSSLVQGLLQVGPSIISSNTVGHEVGFLPSSRQK